MANAIHKTEAGDTLAGIAEEYYALRQPDTSIRKVEFEKVINAIRHATTGTIHKFKNIDILPAGTMVAIPTLRDLNRVILSDNEVLLKDLMAKGFDHARKLLRYTPQDVVKLLKPFPRAYKEEEILNAWVSTAFLNLDGMDRYTAGHFYTTAGIRSMKELAGQSPATIDSILKELASPPHSRPPELLTQDHARRWILSAKINVRKRISELTKIKDRFFQVPFDSSVARKQAEFYENVASNKEVSARDVSLAGQLAKLYHFQAAVLRGHVGLRSGNWSEALAGYQEARRQWHRLAEAIGATSSVNDDDGVNHETSVEAARALLKVLPSEEDSPLGAPSIRLRRAGIRKGYCLRGFRYDELTEQRKQELRQKLANVPVHRLPSKTRNAVHRATLGKTRLEFQEADGKLLEGLIPGPTAAVARDLEEQDRKVLERNLGATQTSTLFEGKGHLQIMDAIADSLPLSDISSFLPDSWSQSPGTGKRNQGIRAKDVLSDQAQAKYPAAFLDRNDVEPATQFIVMPGVAGSNQDRFIPLTNSFAEDYEEELLKPRLISGDAEDLLMDEEVWTSVGPFVAAAPYIYAAQVPLGLRRAYSELNQPVLVRQFGGLRINAYNADGTIARQVATIDPNSSLAFDPDLLACSTDYTGTASVQFPWELLNYSESVIGVADYAYRKEDRAAARSYYADVKCAIEKFFPTFSDEAGYALTGVLLTIQSINNRTFAGIPADRNLRKLTTLDVVIVQNGARHRVMEGTFLPIRTTSDSHIRNLSSVNETLSSYFDFQVKVVFDPVAGPVPESDDDIPEVDLDDPGTPPDPGPGIHIYTDHDYAPTNQPDYLVGSAQLYQLYLYSCAKIQAIDAGLNWYGFSDEFVPSWSFEHLYSVARDLCNRALEAEQRVFSLLQMYETAVEHQFLASQSEELAGAQQGVAEARVEQQIASNQLAMAQALHSQQQAAAQAKKSGVAASITMAVTTVVAAAGAAAGTVLSGGTAAPAIVAGTAAAAGPVAGFVGTITGHTQDVKVLNAAAAVTSATLIANITALNVAIAERDVAELQTEQAQEYVAFLMSKKLNSDAYLFLLGLAKQILETYIHHANRMAWLAERALEHETRQTYDLVAIDYTTQDELTDMTRAQQITAGLEALRSEYVAGQTTRLQEVKWSISLSELDPIAWQDLRDTGACTFILRQRMIDMYFPGLYQHRLKDIRLEIIGLVPPEGVRGVLSNPGVSWVRVPNEQSFLSDQIEDDWTTTSLASSAVFDAYDQYVMKRLLTSIVSLTLSQFDVRTDRAALSAPQGMLTPVQHLGLDSGWTLKLHRQSNNFDFKQVVDVNLTFWFLCAHDPELEEAQGNALIEEGVKGKLMGVSRTAFAIHQPNAWNAFVSEPVDGEAPDVRFLVVDVANLPLWERERKLTNILFACARAASQTNEITLRLCCEEDPVGVLLTTNHGALYTMMNVDTSEEHPPPESDADFEAWVKQTFYANGNKEPSKSPEVRWVIKATPSRVGAGWFQEDEDGNKVTTSSGPLQGWSEGVARYNDGDAWSNVTLQAKVALGGGTARLILRDDGKDHYALELSLTDVRLYRVVDGIETQLGSTLPFAYAQDEYLFVEFSIVDQHLSAAIDHITIFESVDGNPGSGQLEAGTVALHVVKSDGKKAVLFDDVKVIRRTGKGAVAETLLSEPFTAELPNNWTFSGRQQAWEISKEGSPILDLSGLFNIVLNLDYRYQMNTN